MWTVVPGIGTNGHILGGETEMGVFKKQQVSPVYGRNQEQVGRSQVWSGQLTSQASVLRVV